jgi:hypothetical protein
MQKEVNSEMEDDLRPEYDLSKLKNRVRGKYAERYKAGTNLVLLAPDVARAFPDAASVNEALRMLMRVAEASSHPRREA